MKVTVTIEGLAENASRGAIVTVGRTPVYVDGLERWDAAHSGKQVTVTGALYVEPGDEVVNAKGERSHGTPDGRFMIESASWKVS
jgi:hypothetical protein